MSWKPTTAPSGPVAVPRTVARLAGDVTPRPVWQNEVGGTTWSCGARHIKWNPHGNGIDLTDEAERMRWASSSISCPRVLDDGGDDDGSWLITHTVDATSAVDAERSMIARAVEAIADGLRRLHDAAAVDRCPFTWSTRDRRGRARARLAEGTVDPRYLHPQHQQMSVLEMDRLLAELPSSDPVVCHGDPCTPNTLIDDGGGFAALVDLGALGCGDRWADLAVAAWSLEWNFGHGWTDRFLDTYGIARDDDQLAWYQLLWDLG